MSNTVLPYLGGNHKRGLRDAYRPQATGLIDKANAIEAPFNTDFCRGETKEAPVMATPTILIGAQASAWAVAAFAAGFHVGHAIGKR